MPRAQVPLERNAAIAETSHRPKLPERAGRHVTEARRKTTVANRILRTAGSRLLRRRAKFRINHCRTADLTDGLPAAFPALDPVLSCLVQRVEEYLARGFKADAVLETVRFGSVRIKNASHI